MLRPLDPDFNRAIMLLAPRHRVADFAPSTFADIMAQPRPLTVWSGASDDTIYADPAVNWAFRAWHDSNHIAGAHDFTMAGEAATCERQIRELLRAYPGAPKRWQDIIRAEINGQAQFAAEHGYFPTDQAAFIKQAIGD